MPVIQVPISTTIDGRAGRRMAICTESGIATEADVDNGAIHAYDTPSYLHTRTVGFTPLNREERDGIPWNHARVVYKLFQSVISVIFQIDILISSNPEVESVNRVYMTRIAGEPTNVIQSRIRQAVALPLHIKYVERRTAVAMALHPRLGGSSAMRVTGNEMMELVLSYV